MSASVKPKRYSLLLFATEVVTPTSIVCQSMFSSKLVIALGAMILVTNPLLSFANASFLNPADIRANCPKFEFELVIDASPPVSAKKCWLNPIAKTETI